MQINFLLVQLLLATIFFFPFARSINAQKQSTCDQALHFVKNDIEKRVGGLIDYVTVQELNNSPFNVNAGIIFRFVDSNSAISFSNRFNANQLGQKIGINETIIYHSPELNKSYAQRIINSCGPVVRVTFSIWESVEESRSWSLHPNGGDNVLLQDECIPKGFEQIYASDFSRYGSPDYVRWGYLWCPYVNEY